MLPEKNMKDKVYLTKEGLTDLQKELKQLVEVERVTIAERIKSARENNDISENAEYESARDRQSFVEGRIRELEEILKNVSVIAENKKTDIIGLGSTVKVHIDGGDEVFKIVGAPEANPIENKISHESPLGEALLGKKIGQHVEVDAPIGKLTYTVLSIE